MEPARATSRVEFANALRGFAAFTVVIAHLFGFFWYARDTAGISANTVVPSVEAVPIPGLVQWLNAVPINWGPFGVALFFLISGFVIPFSLQKASAAQFLIGRGFRIFPLYAAGFAVTLTALWASGRASGLALQYSTREMLVGFFPGLRELFDARSIDGVVWTLEVELKFYLICAVLAPPLRAGSRYVFLAPVVLTIAALSKIPEVAFPSFYLLFMFIGVAAHYVFAGHLGRLQGLAVVSAIAAAFWKVCFATGQPVIVPRSYTAALAVFTAAFVLGRHWPRTRVLSFMADISYPLYVVHGVAGYALMAYLLNRGVGPYLVLIAATAAAILVSWVLHVLVEAPAHRLGQRLSRGRAGSTIRPGLSPSKPTLD